MAKTSGMVDVSSKDIMVRTAKVSGTILFGLDNWQADFK